MHEQAVVQRRLKLALYWLLWPALIVYIAALNWHRGPAAMLVWTVGILAASLGASFLNLRLVRRALWRRFREPSPEPLIEWMRRTLGRASLPHTDHTIATTNATIRAFYGQFARALDELDERNWNELPAGHRAAALQARALVHYLSRDDLTTGLQSAREAQALVQADTSPLANTWRVAAATYVDIGRVFLEPVDAELATELTARAAKLRVPSVRLITLWAAALACQQTGRSTQANALIAQLQALVPHCKPLHDLQLTAARAVPPLTAASPIAGTDSEHGNCAAHPEAAAQAHCVRCGDYCCTACTRTLTDRASICVRCYDMLGELRKRHEHHEKRIRAAGALAQAGAVFFALVLSIPLFTRVEQSWSMRILGLLYPLLMAAFFFWTGRRLRRTMLGFRGRLTLIGASLVLMVPVGTALGGYYLWLAYGPLYQQLQTPDYVRALSARPDLNPGSPWRFVVGVCALLFVNLMLFVVVLQNVLG